ncbi:MAG: lyase family protein [Candidatus Aenigmarchaeota archaeon]|nr:lyase family protein [Candidatus Aenigmarchaeota archaeon]
MSEERISIYDLFSPTDYRYSVKELRPYLSEESFVKYKSKIEAALAKVLARRGIISQQSAEEISKASEQVTAKEVYEEESKTGHDIIAQVNMIRKRISDEAKTGVHRTATSYDIVDTANALRYRDAFTNVILPDMVSLEKVWIDIARNEKDTLQIGRTHLQHAEPITFGFAMAWYVSRFGRRILKVKEAVEGLEGKFSGAVGAYNASYLFVEEPEEFEREVLAEVGLNPTEISTQITQPEPIVDLMHYITSSFTILANWADDMRNLQRPEIGEIGQPRGKDVSRSSTMPHKANPVGLENIKSMWKATMPYMFMMYLDQISDHQRDLTNSASQRYVPQILNQFDYCVRRATRISRNLKPHVQNMLRNFKMSEDKIIAEPLHLLLSAYGHPNSHEYVSKLVDESYTNGKPLTEIVRNDQSLQPYLQKFTPKQLDIISDPSKYLGIASKKAEEIANLWEQRLKKAELL